MSLTSKPGKREWFRDRLKPLDAPTTAARSGGSPIVTHNSQDAITPVNTLFLRTPTNRSTFHTQYQATEPRGLENSPQTSVVSSTLPVNSSAPDARTQIQVHTVQASAILADAIEALDEQERETVRTLLSPNTIKIDDALHDAYNVAKELQARSAMKRWSWTYRGRQVYIQDQADKLVRFIDRFKSVGDAIANIDPLHIGLPWAGFRSILDLALLDGNKRGAIATGMELAVFASHRLQVYFNMQMRLPSSLASESLRQAVVNLYATVLKFLAQTIDFQPRSIISRVARQLWSPDDLQRFEEECDRLCEVAEQEANICDREAGAQWRDRLERSLRSLKDIHDITTSLSRVHDKLDLAKLTYAKDATYDSAVDSELARCLPGTRTELLKSVDKWATDVGGDRIFWLCGKAGTGKSTIARTVAQKLDDNGLLAASFFFKRGHLDRSHAKLVFPTIARQLADKFQEVGRLIASALDRDSLICSKELKAQFDQLLSLPFMNLGQLLTPSAGIVLVVDALDECESSADIKTILLLLSRVEEIVSVRLRIFVTSRPELPVEIGFRDMTRSLYHVIRLEEAQQTTIGRDIRAFYLDQFDKIREESRSLDDELPDNWPGDENVDILVRRAVPLFIFAFTISRFLFGDPRKRLHLLLSQRPKKALGGLEDTYLPILRQVVLCDGDDQRRIRIRNFQTIVGSIVLLCDPLSASALEDLLGIHGGVIGRTLRPLGAVLNVPRMKEGKIDRAKPITLFHLSFRDFLTTSSLQGMGEKLGHENDVRINADAAHGALGKHCIRLLNSGTLREDVCSVELPGTRRADVTKSTVHTSLPEAVTYACCFWVQHFAVSGSKIVDEGPVHQFLKNHLLHWMEAMSWLGKSSDVIQDITALRSLANHDEGKHLSSMLDDASHFALRNRYIINEAPLQTYMSAVLFTPSMRNVHQMLGGGLERYLKSIPKRWSTKWQKLEGHNRSVSVVAFSPDGKIVASGSEDTTVRLWDAATGEQRQRLKGHKKPVGAVAFSPDGKTVASGSDDNTIKLWDTMTGQLRQNFEGHNSYVSAVAFSPDGKTMASGSWDKTVRLWDAATGEQRQRLERHNRPVSAVTFSSDSETVASGSGNQTIRLWDVVTGKQRQKFEGNDCYVRAIALSTDGETVALGSDDKTVRLWDAATGEERYKHQTSRVVSRIAFSSFGSSLETDIGQLEFGNVLGTHRPFSTAPQPTLMLETSWIKYRGADFLWLPHEYRGVSHDSHGALLAIGQATGAVSLFSFR